MKFDRDVRDALERERLQKLDMMRRVAEKQVARYYAEGRTRNAEVFGSAAKSLFEDNDPTMFGFLQNLKRLPVPIEEFLDSKDFMGGVDMEIWPQVRQDIITVNPDICLSNRRVVEYIDSGATGCHAPGARIRMQDGTHKAVEDVRVGEDLMGPDGRPRRVLALATGVDYMRRLMLRDGSYHDVNKGHILSLKREPGGRPFNLPVGQFQHLSACMRKDYFLWKPGPEGDTLIPFVIENLPRGEYHGFALSGDHLYMTADGIVHHNTGKTAKASITNAYQLYILHCMTAPQRMYGLAAQTPIVFSLTSSNLATTYDVLYRPFRSIVENIPFFNRYIIWNRDKTSVLEMEKNIVVEPVNATTQGIIGRAVIGGHMDEANYLSVIVGSSRSTRGDGRGGVYDQAEQFYRAIRLRKKSRFSSQYPVPGLIILSSSVKHNEDFLDRRIAEVRSIDGGEPGVEVFRHKQYDVQPASRFTAARFRLLVGTVEYPTRILKDEELPGVHYPEDARIELVPETYRYEFTHRPEDALRDVCGISTVNLSPFITQREKIVEAVQRWREAGNEHPIKIANVVLAEHGMPIVDGDLLDADVTTPRFIHIDLSRKKDRCGIAMVRVDEMVEVQIDDGVFERVPKFTVEIAVSIQPSQVAELDIAAVRNWAVALKTLHGVPVYMVTYDGFDSAESIQALRRIGIRSEVISMDRSDEAYQIVKRALYQDRLDIPNNEVLIDELIHLERDEKSGKVDHPPKKSKDISDAVAGACFSAISSRHYRSQIYFTDGKGNRIMPPGR